MAKSKELTIQCSNCGAIQAFANDSTFPDSVPASGWGSYGRALYCPECCRTWTDRNPDKGMATKANTSKAALRYTNSQRRG